MSKKNQALEEIIKKNHTLIKRYDFRKGDVALPFSLNVKDQNELQIFIDLMKEAIIEVENDINNLILRGPAGTQGSEGIK